MGGFLVVPAGLLAAMKGVALPTARVSADLQSIAARARQIVMEEERKLGFVPTDRETEKLGYDVENVDPQTGCIRFIEVKGRAAGTPVMTVTRNEILTSLNKPEDFLPAIAEFESETSHKLHYIRRPFRREPDFGVTSVNYGFSELIGRASLPG
jgi:hypothetical protein